MEILLEKDHDVTRSVVAWVAVFVAHVFLLFLLSLVNTTSIKPQAELKFELVDVNPLETAVETTKSKGEPIVNSKVTPEKPIVKKKVIPKTKETPAKPKKNEAKKIIATQKSDSKFVVAESATKSEVDSHQKSKEMSATDHSVANSNVARGSNSGGQRQQGNGSVGKNQKAGFIKAVKPPYPLQARKMGQEGVVRLGINISEQGIVQSTKVVKSSGFVVLDNSALNTYKKIKFRPAIQNGKAIPSYLEFNVVFNIQD